MKGWKKERVGVGVGVECRECIIYNVLTSYRAWYLRVCACVQAWLYLEYSKLAWPSKIMVLHMHTKKRTR